MNRQLIVALIVLVFLLMMSTLLKLNIEDAQSLLFSLLFYFLSIVMAVLVMWIMTMGYYSTQWARNRIHAPMLMDTIVEEEETKQLAPTATNLLPTNTSIPPIRIVNDMAFMQTLETQMQG